MGWEGGLTGKRPLVTRSFLSGGYNGNTDLSGIDIMSWTLETTDGH